MGLGIISLAPFVLQLLLYLGFCNARDAITSSQFIQDPEFIVSSGSIFKLGFFSPVNSTNRYVGIWYNNISLITPVWVANREKPLNDSSGVLKLSEDGNLVVLNGGQEILWTSNVSNGVNTSTAILTDAGNLVLQLGTNGNSIWESFQQPSDTFLKTMKLTANEKTGQNVRLTSWTSLSNPKIGSFSVGLEPSSTPQIFIWKDSHPYWRSGPWSGHVFIGIPGMSSVYLTGLTLGEDEDGTFELSYTYRGPILYSIVLDSEGKLRERYSETGKESWEYTDWEAPKTECDVYGKCGYFGICNQQNSPICSCLTGFEPKITDEWNGGNWTSGCVRRTLLQCERVQNNNETGKGDGFFQVNAVQVPDFAQWSSASSDQDCKVECLKSCSCMAYAYRDDMGCMLWNESLMDVQKFSSEGTDLYIRLAYSELDRKKNMKLIISITTILGAIAILICAFTSWRWMTKQRRDKFITIWMQSSNGTGAYSSDVEGNSSQNNFEQVQLRELPLLKLQQLAAATNNFDISNKLGQGGFGPVYKGKLPNGREIAVKRLSRASGQGLEEFMNEVEVISKLQHRNLVRLVGCCIEAEEKMLVYEYMPNNSLDKFLFDQHKRELLDWRKRFAIIEGICRGLIYLHRDSRIKIVHRDLKPSNILLDQELNPKISDFGMAKIFGGNEDQANTRRVVGTYGYMSPEYAMQGRFSEKSDVFSFGVLLLEIVSGRRNTDFYDNEQALNLLAFAWKLWNEGNYADLVDPVIRDPCFLVEVFRCIHIGLLCVQEFAKDRPSVSIAMSMLNSEILDLPTPKQPAFSERNFGIPTHSAEQCQKKGSINNLTLTAVQGR